MAPSVPAPRRQPKLDAMLCARSHGLLHQNLLPNVLSESNLCAPLNDYPLSTSWRAQVYLLYANLFEMNTPFAESRRRA